MDDTGTTSLDHVFAGGNIMRGVAPVILAWAKGAAPPRIPSSRWCGSMRAKAGLLLPFQASLLKNSA